MKYFQAILFTVKNMEETSHWKVLLIPYIVFRSIILKPLLLIFVILTSILSFLQDYIVLHKLKVRTDVLRLSYYN